MTIPSINNYEILLLDAANTIIHKPDLWINFGKALENNGIELDLMELRKKHKLVSELIHFPDQTSEGFYNTFNYELLLTLGIVPNEKLLSDIFKACTYLPWQPFEDTDILANLSIKKAILSNFNSSLKHKIENIFGLEIFDTIIGSEEQSVGKPDIRFYQRALEILKTPPEKILYIGDSLKLDVIPAKQLRIDAWLIDRDKNFIHFNKRISSLAELHQ